MKLFGRKSVPPTMTLEGVLGPNDRLEAADTRSAPGARAMAVAADGALLVNDESRLLRIADWGAEAEAVHQAPASIAALTVAPNGCVALVCEGGSLHVLTPDFAPTDWPRETGVKLPTDAAFLSDDELLVSDSGVESGEDMLARATWEEEAKGSVVAVSHSGRRIIAKDLHAPAGLCVSDGRILVTEMERARIRDAATGAVLQSGLPGYAGRLARTPQGFLLSCIARRDPLIEFLKSETAFVRDMKATIAPAHWIAPRIDPQFSHDLPIEMGATRLFGEVKAWAPSFSYGLVIALDRDLNPVGSAQSRANGRRHAIAAAVPWGGGTVALSLGTGELLRLEDFG